LNIIYSITYNRCLVHLRKGETLMCVSDKCLQVDQKTW
jgi:hypothetical protein